MPDMLETPAKSKTPVGAYPERPDSPESWSDLLSKQWNLNWLRTRARPLLLRRFLRKVASHGEAYRSMRSHELSQEGVGLQTVMRTCGFREDVVAQSFALIREVAGRTVGQRHYDVQIVGGWGLVQGMVSEMGTGEGKTLTATLAAGTAALGGRRVHIITVNDYLAQRDADLMGPVYRALGLRVGVVVHGMEHRERHEAYGCDVTYCTNKEIVFDYLRDRLILGPHTSRLRFQVARLEADTRRGRLLLRGLEYAIVDELDSVLVDEARTPIILSTTQRPEGERMAYETALKITESLNAGDDFQIDKRERHLGLTARGKAKIEELVCTWGKTDGVWARSQLRQELVLQALKAKHLFLRDRDYIVRNSRVEIVDEYTGRTMPDRSWEHGLHQAIEVKENCPLTPQNRPVARLSYQRFFRRYLHLAGMTGTVREVSRELASVYGLGVLKVPPHRPIRRLAKKTQVFLTAEEKWEAIVRRVECLHRTGRPVLVGTRSVEASEHLSQLLGDRGLEHQVLNARQDKREAELIKRAGEPASITLATNMAGRGTDIRLNPDVVQRGGLHVIASELHEARRIDRQLFGRCGRQGDPGSYEAILSLEDDLIQTYGGKGRCRRPTQGKKSNVLKLWLGEALFRHAQRAAERRHCQIRRNLLDMHEKLERTLAFSGTRE